MSKVHPYMVLLPKVRSSGQFAATASIDAFVKLQIVHFNTTQILKSYFEHHEMIMPLNPVE